MANKNRERVKHVTPIEYTEPNGVKEIVETNSIEQITYGWQDSLQVAAEVWRQGNLSLLEGDLMFAYKNTESAGSKLYQIVVVKYFDWIPGTATIEPYKHYNGLYGYSVVTSGYSVMIPKFGADYLEEIYNDLITYKVNKQILSIFRTIIDNETSSN